MTTIAKYGAAGALAGVVLGIAQTFRRRNKSATMPSAPAPEPAPAHASESAHPPEKRRIINLEFAKDVQEALEPFKRYKVTHADIYQALEENMDRLVGFFLLARNKRVDAGFGFNAKQCAINVEQLLSKLDQRVKSPSLEQPIKDLNEAANRYYSNLQKELSLALPYTASEQAK